MNTNIQLDSIELKIRQLALKMERLQKDNIALVEENKQLKSKVAKQRDALNEFESEQNRLKDILTEKQQDDPKDVQQIRKEIDFYIKEVDKCIEYLYDN